MHPIRQRLFWPTLLTALGVLGLFSLGTWQLERKTWKDELVRTIQTRAKAEPIVLDAAAGLLAAGEALEYARVRARGRFIAGTERYYYAPGPTGPGWHVYAPLETPNGSILLVNRGFVPEALKDPAKRSKSETARDVEIVGLLRRPEVKNWFSPTNDSARNTWYWRDLAGMKASLALPGNPEFVPFFLDAEAAPGATGDYPRGGVTRVQFANRHLEYALTWYGLGLALIIVYLAFAWSAFRAGCQSRGRLFGARNGWGKP